MKFILTLCLLASLALASTACGSRVYPKTPSGKITPSQAY